MSRRKAATAPPNLYFRDGSVLSIPGYNFEKAVPWADTGSLTLIAEGSSLKDGSNVLAKVAPAHSNGSLLLEREAHILGRMATSEAGTMSTALRMIDFFTIPPGQGDCVVLLLAHPGLNLLGRYFPPFKVNSLLLADASRVRPSSVHHDIYMLGLEEPDSIPEEMEAFDVMDLATFLEFAIQATHCLESIHKLNLTHREVRANAFHLNIHSGTVRLCHFGNRAISLEQYGSPSELVIQSEALEEPDKLKVKEALCYMAPEQTGSVETTAEDSRTDLYSLGIMFWTLLVGRGQLPFEGPPLELLHAIVQKRPMPVHEVRRDLPQVLAAIVDKLLSKSPENRYQSAYGLKEDLLECQRRLLSAVSAGSEQPQASELIPFFEIAQWDRYMEFTLPMALFGREKESETLRNIMRHTSRSFARPGAGIAVGVSSGASSGQETGAGSSLPDEVNDDSDSRSTTSAQGDTPARTGSASPGHDSTATPTVTGSVMSGMSQPSPSPSPSAGPDGLRRLALAPQGRTHRARAVIVMGAPGAGKSSLVLACQARWRAHGLWGHAKFQLQSSAPFSALLACLSSVLRQLLAFQTDLYLFVTGLRVRLGPQLQNIPLLYSGAPELRYILAAYDIHMDTPQEALAGPELKARFQSLFIDVLSVLSETRLLAIFLDDVQDADASSIELISNLVNSKSRVLLFTTLRNDQPAIVDNIKTMFTSRSRVTWIHLEALSFSAISSLVSRTLRRPKEDVSILSGLVHAISHGNAFSARNLLQTLHRQHHIVYDQEKNHWRFNQAAIEASLLNKDNGNQVMDPSDPRFLAQHLAEMPEDSRRFIIWSSFFGSTFKITEVALMVDWEDSSGSSASDSEADEWNLSKAITSVHESANARSMRGLQQAITDGWLIQRGRDMCGFAHDRYRQAAEAEAQLLPPEVIARMSFMIILMILHDTSPDPFTVAQHARRCLSLIRDHVKREELLNLLIDAGDSAWTRGAHETSLSIFESAKELLPADAWNTDFQRCFTVYIKIVELLTWRGDQSETYLDECLVHAATPEDKARVLNLRSRSHWIKNDYPHALDDLLTALKGLRIDVNASATREEADRMFEVVKDEILGIGFDDIIAMPRTTDPVVDLAMSVLGAAGMYAFWSPESKFCDVIGLTMIRLSLKSGMSTCSALGFFWALGASAERFELYRFSCDLAKLGVKLAELHGGPSEKCRAQVLYSSFASGYDNVHLRTMLPHLDDAVKLGHSAGDRPYTAFANVYALATRLYIGEHVNELVTVAEEVLRDTTAWTAGTGDAIILAQGVLNCIRALGGFTHGGSPSACFDTDHFKENEFLVKALKTCGNIPLSLNWYNAFKVVALYSLGHISEAAELGFFVYETRHLHPNHRHPRYGLFFHALALIACVRDGNMPEDQRAKYIQQAEANCAYIRKWLSPSPVNTSVWVALLDAELAALLHDEEAFKLYDISVKLAVSTNWPLEEGWALWLQGCHFIRNGVEGLGLELKQRGIAHQAQWGCRGIVDTLSRSMETGTAFPFPRLMFRREVAVQTDSSYLGNPQASYEGMKIDVTDEDDIGSLSAADLASILKWSKDISSDINLSSALQRITEIATERSGSQCTSVVIAREAGDYTVATTMYPPDLCQVYENPMPVRAISDTLQRAVIQATLEAKDRLHFNDTLSEPRFAAEAILSSFRSVMCLPIQSNRGQTFGAVYLASKYPFSRNTVNLLTLFCQQASISVANALLFRSVQAGMRENLRMIASQRDALEAARRSREDALKATKIKSNFLASMSHELRTPFSSFYGLLDILDGTDMTPGQREIVQTAKQSCELLLKIIDSILDYSKLEASALKLDFQGFPVENLVADCLELLLPMAAKKLDLSFFIKPEVPMWINADYARIRQVLMNLIGNAVKFTPSGSVKVICSLDDSVQLQPPDVVLKFTIQDTGIGMSASDREQLFTPFQQADNSSTRRFGGTGLGLSISRQLVKLQQGTIGVFSDVGQGSTFWFTIPTTIFESEVSRKTIAELESLKMRLMQPSPPRILIASPSDTTQSHLSGLLSGFHVSCFPSTEEVNAQIANGKLLHAPIDFIFVDEQSEVLADDLAILIEAKRAESASLKETKVIHLYTPTADSISGAAQFLSAVPGVVKMTKPPRQARLLQMLAGLKNIPNVLTTATAASGIASAIDDLAAARRTLFGNVLVAEDNPVAQKLLVKQLEKFGLNVFPTNNGEEAIAEWERHEPGYFSLALFDHHMPVCDGVEATKRLRVKESQRRARTLMPIVALSADCQESTKALCLSAGMNGFLSKPLKRPDLLTLLSSFGSGPAQPLDA